MSKESYKDWYSNHKEYKMSYVKLYKQEHKDANRAWTNKGAHNLKIKLLEHYGSKCACCGEENIKFLTLDHINNDGAEHRRRVCGKNIGSSTNIYRWVINNNFPDGFQILCYNCNLGRAHNNGICPHKEI